MRFQIINNDLDDTRTDLNNICVKVFGSRDSTIYEIPLVDLYNGATFICYLYFPLENNTTNSINIFSIHFAWDKTIKSVFCSEIFVADNFNFDFSIDDENLTIESKEGFGNYLISMVPIVFYTKNE